MKVRNVLGLTVLVMLLAVPAARADFFVSPLVGGNFGGDTNTNSRKTPFGVSFGYMGGGVIGYETSFIYTPSFFGNKDAIGSNNVFSLMGNLIVGVPLGGSVGDRQIRPYVSAGAGLLRSRIGGGANDLFDITSNDFGVNVGAGAMGFFTPHVGLRGDIRYFRSLTDNGTSNLGPVNLTDIGIGKFNFWQATVGVAFKF